MPAAWRLRTIPLNSETCLALRAAAGVFRFRREVADRVVAPVIRQAFIDQNLVVDKRVHRQQLHRRDAQIG